MSNELIPIRSRRAFLTGALGMACLPLGRALAQTADDPWPRRFVHALGEITLDKPARRVVSLGYTSQDSILALDVVPLAVRYWFGDAPFGVWPWAADRLQGQEPVLLTGESGVETVAALEPDLIVGIGSGIAQAEYDLLSQIAPVLMQDADAPVYGMGWDRLTALMGRATGKDEAAKALIAATKARFAAVRAEHPDWQGKTAVAAYHFNGEAGLYLTSDGRSRFLTDLGFALSPVVTAQPNTDFYMPLSPEDLSGLEADVLVWISTSDTDKDLAALPMRRLLGVHRQGGEVFAAGDVSSALSFGSVLSLPWALDRIEADIAAAADGDPATPVASSVAAGLAP
ncbi:ABC transporter substrate-binding protein [Neogemmobacter tilapiae]|uniref:ABC transporter substrate-binding protein n=1 Tax=Neogemmobacter tilapiae TaxID=875041 RepID=A0A918TWX2_9RHOB|nr:ABC transporter substrate-binding protein [Gemmobacter tilapiae]GHC60281.1 ABC transporter substrate-binding protein [Gemmobacter tilapiae]